MYMCMYDMHTMYIGAKNRAAAAQKAQADADFAIGLEGGLEKVNYSSSIHCVTHDRRSSLLMTHTIGW